MDEQVSTSLVFVSDGIVIAQQFPDNQGLGMCRHWTGELPPQVTVVNLLCVLEAASDIDTVNGLWKGLGYYSRAARLLAGAKKAVEELGGRLPDNANDMEALI